MTEKKCPLCKLRFLQALWCPLATEGLAAEGCPVTKQRAPTAEMRQQLKMDDAPIRFAD